ncbi:uncharacterized protein LOC134268476 [Saccostrea cucullata]|uniref:uncharacterized protein LOC134268476 n=1 Tax=Saccostrea cuccullata TaxID=36930 RepID=UPI002ED030D9
MPIRWDKFQYKSDVSFLSNDKTVAVQGTKVWTTKEAKALFEMRKEYEEKFGSMKCHKTLWAQISSSLSKAGVVASAMQCSNKWKSLKREYKKTIDHNSHTGNEKKTCQFYEDFNEMYGHRSGTQPEFVMSSRSTEKECRRKSDSHNDESLESPGPSSTKEKEKKAPKRKGRHDANLEFLEKYAKKQESFQKDRLDLLKEQHVEKMSMMDKLMNCFKQKQFLILIILGLEV